MSIVEKKVADFVLHLKSGNNTPVCIDSFIRLNHDKVKEFLISLRDASAVIIHEFTAVEIENQRLAALEEAEKSLLSRLDYLNQMEPSPWFTANQIEKQRENSVTYKEWTVQQANTTYSRPFIVEHPKGWNAPFGYEGRFLLKYRDSEGADDLNSGTGPFKTLEEARDWFLNSGR